MHSVLGSAEALQRCVVVIALDMSSPWSLVAALRKWLDVLAAFVQSSLDGTRLAQLQAHSKRRFASYVDPSVAASAGGSSLAALTADVGAQLELPPGALQRNLGVPIVVACCKSDCYEALERDFDFGDAAFELIERALRTVCLEYGAALCYTSAARATNCAELLALVRAGLASAAAAAATAKAEPSAGLAAFAALQPPPLADAKERVCIPFGFDSLAKINVGHAADSAALLDRFADALPSNRRALLSHGSSVDATVAADSDAEFVARMRALCDADPTAPAGAPALAAGGGAGAGAPATPSNAAAAAASAVLTSTPSAVPAGLSTPVSKPSPKTAAAAAATVNVSDKGEREVLSDFFNSLMAKTPTKATPSKQP
jgi:hypothetical protein